MASFDGLNALGQPYAPGSSSAGASDTLTSQPIQLGSLNPRDSLYLSFYWQSGGLGDVPDRTESNLRYLLLEFKDRAGAWREVWRQAAVGEVTDFAQVFVGVKDPVFYHDVFQFRFRNVGLRNGIADVWNLDYIELFENIVGVGNKKGIIDIRNYPQFTFVGFQELPPFNYAYFIEPAGHRILVPPAV